MSASAQDVRPTTWSRRKLYLGHSAGDVTGLHERQEFLAWREEDTGKLRAYAGVVLEAMSAGLKLVEGRPLLSPTITPTALPQK